MALVSVDFFSDVLMMGTSVTVCLPEVSAYDAVGPHVTVRPEAPPVLYLLHGLSDDHGAWQRFTSAERYASEAGLALVMPRVDRSFYADERQGHRYWTFLTEELPVVVQGWLRVSERREDTFVAGLSMGGYGALKWALRQPGRFAAAASMSGALDLAALAAEPDREDLMQRVFGGVVAAQDDLFSLLDAPDLPPLWVGCGTEDHLFPHNQAFVEAARARGLDPVVEFRPGDHTWELWDAMLAEVIAWLPVSPPASPPGPSPAPPSLPGAATDQE